MTHRGPILVTGAGGRLGTLLRAAHRRRDSTVGDAVFQSRGEGADLQWTPGDPLSRLPRCDTLVALWGQTAGDAATLSQNATLADLSIEIARACGARRVLHLSTAGVFGPGHDMAETAPLAPVSAYGRAKCEMEARIARARPASDTRHVILRLANVVGADSLAPALRGPGPVRLDRFADGAGPRRSYIAPGDVWRVLCHLAALDPDRCPEILNVAAPGPVDMAALARAAARPIVWQDAPKTATQNVTLDVTRLARLLGPVTLLSHPQALVANWKALET